MRAVDMIAKKRDGGEHTDQELRFLVSAYTQGDIPDYQMSAWLMAVVWRGLSEAETFTLTGAMADSGDRLDLSGLGSIAVDKHSTGGVGDKTTLAVVPILASAGVPVAKMSGRGLGQTGGTLDKLESIPGVRVTRTPAEILAQVRSVGACICAQTEQLVPADRKLYALRDATATVESMPLIAASVMSKKLAGGAQAIVLDVKFGSGAFMKTETEARALADLMIRIGQAHDRRVAAVLSDMNAPLGRAIGNRLEVQEVMALLQNPTQADPRLRALICHLAAVALTLCGKTGAIEEGRTLAENQLASGAALEKWRQIIAAQGGNADATLSLPPAPVQWEVRATQSGFLAGMDAAVLGEAAMRLGAGRATKEDRIDPAAGIILQHTMGQRVAAGDTLATLHTATEQQAQNVAPAVARAFLLANAPGEPPPLIGDTLGL